MIETTRVDEWLYGLLSADLTLTPLIAARAYRGVAPAGTVYPLLVYNLQAGSDVRGVGPARVMTSLLYQVKAIGTGNNFTALEPIVDRVDALLQGVSGSVVGGQILACVRETPVAYTEIDGDQQYSHLGGLYRIWAQ